MRWEPLEDGPHKLEDIYGGGLVILASIGSTMDVYDSRTRVTVDLPANIRLCRQVEDGDAVPEDVEETLRTTLQIVRNGLPSRAFVNEYYAKQHAGIDAALAWLDSLQKEATDG